MKVSPLDVESNRDPNMPTDLKALEDMQRKISKRRKNEIEDLVLGNHDPISLRYLTVPVFCMAAVVLAIYTGLSLMPSHDIMKDPSYWYFKKIKLYLHV